MTKTKTKAEKRDKKKEKKMKVSGKSVFGLKSIIERKDKNKLTKIKR
ncbi:MAG TPA: hypothetical protein VK255_04240 [Patescibacteria group bacterium]|nr:hypothetical protein [Patescibacteria group bacterium]